MEHATMVSLPQWDVELYERENGRGPVKEFIYSLQVQERVWVQNKLDRLQRHALGLGGDYFKHLEQDSYEYRLQSRRGSYRFLYILFDGHKFVILHAFRKKTNKTPRKEIETAKRYRDESLDQVAERRRS
jgi:phage-related protein